MGSLIPFIELRLSRLLFFAVALFLSQATGRAQEELVEKYGKSSSPPITKGFFFVDGVYIEAPYFVQRVGLNVYINGHLIDPGHEPHDWRVYEDP